MGFGSHRRGFYVSLVFSILAMCISITRGPAQAAPVNLITNGTFDSDLSGWTLSSQTYGSCVNTEPVAQDPSFLFTPQSGSAAWLNACGGLTGQPQISQNITTTPGSRYALSGYVRRGAYWTASDTFANFRVLVDGAARSVSLPDGDAWVEFSVCIVATSSSTTVSFRGEESADIDYFIDSISMSLAPSSGAPTAPTNCGGTGHTGTVALGSTLTVTEGSWTDGGATITNTAYQWESSSNGLTWSSITGATSSTLTLGTTDIGKYFRVTVTKTNSVGSTTATGTASGVVPDTSLTNLAISSGTLAPSFASGTFSYTASVNTSVTSITVTPTSAGGTITVNGTAVTSGQASGAISLSLGSNTITVVVSASGVSTTTTLTVTQRSETVAPVFSSAATNIAGTTVTLTYDEALSSTTAASSAFAVTVGGVARSVSGVAVSGSTVVLTLASAVAAGQTVTVAYTDPAATDDANAVQDIAGNDAVSLAPTSVTNNSTVDLTPPTVTLAASSATSASTSITFTITGNEPIDCTTLSTVAGADFGLSGITAISSIVQTTTTICTVNATSSATAGGGAVTSTLTAAPSFSITDTVGNAQTTLAGSPQSVTVTVPAPSGGGTTTSTTTTVPAATTTTTTTTTTTVPAATTTTSTTTTVPAATATTTIRTRRATTTTTPRRTTTTTTLRLVSVATTVAPTTTITTTTTIAPSTTVRVVATTSLSAPSATSATMNRPQTDAQAQSTSGASPNGLLVSLFFLLAALFLLFAVIRRSNRKD